MPTITMWRTDNRRCILRVEQGRFDLQIAQGSEVVHQHQPKSADKAVLLAGIWRETYGDGTLPQPR
jgi:hypothetical protein